MNNKRKIQQLRLEKSKKELKENKKELRGSNYKKKSNFQLLDIIFKKEAKRYTVEDTIPYLRMLKNGICQIDEKHFNKCISFEDINYQLALEEDRDLIFNQFANFLNSFDPSVGIELSYINQLGRNKEMQAAIQIPDKNDGFDDIRLEFREMLKNQLAKGNNGLKKSKYIIFTIEADTKELAISKLERLEIDILSNLKSMGVRAESLTGEERLKILHDVLNPNKTFDFSYKYLKKKESTKTYITPDEFNFAPSKYFKFGKFIGAVSHFQILASELSDRMLSEFLDIDDNINISFHIKSVEQSEAIKMVKRKNTDIDKMKIEEQKKAVRAGYDMDIIPSDINTYGEDVKLLLKDLQARDERMFIVTIIFMNFARTIQKLDNTIAQISSIANRHNCGLKRLDHEQEQGFISVLPLGVNKIEIDRGLTSSSTAVFMPFTTEELFIDSANSLYYGLNALSHNIIMADRKMLKNPNGLILGTPGSGKSFSAKREMANAILTTDDDILICDPEGEYGSLVKQFNGEVIKVSAKSKDYLNPLDINMNYGDGDAPLKDKANFIMSMLELVVGGSGLTAEEKSVIDRCLPKIYEKYFENPIPENMPILQDLYDMLKNQEEKVGKKLATEMEIYVSGSLNVFNHRSNVDLNKQLLCFDIKELGTQLKKIGMLVIQDQVWNKVSQNRGNKATRYYIDEFHLLLKEEQTAAYSVEIWKRFRKWGGIPTGITQNVKDLLMSKEIENIFDNTDFVLMLNQASGDRDILAKKLKISPPQLKYVTNSNAGEGLVFFGNTIVPFVDKFPKDTILYQKMTTKPEEVR
ncbi:TPA: ATP-binding protein [Streptococcus equi subsp. zooepidemicus]|nr:ATP-binding protein [Streptococcus equi subsp. zooepidemicus]HEL0011299.1 ATP-binding protein [Streptococcus equi subsp. zooepidemicus]HEL0013369.1 ATP-binding protein [Streptococcus equi subsp. zooepidemicus]HEL0017477.1 ATP-binding protein [Streptococcus equi subsp. zooepidemicus]HEL0029333.1 ATP-binding protein [Streptococcus equi subsp. zooepidemicus]